MKTVSGVLYLTKTEIKELRTLLHHTRIDIGWGENGTLGNGTTMNKRELREVSNAIGTIESIIEIVE